MRMTITINDDEDDLFVVNGNEERRMLMKYAIQAVDIRFDRFIRRILRKHVQALV